MRVIGEKEIYKQKLNRSPNYLMIEPTNKCNLRCRMCSREELTDIGDMNYDFFLKIMNQFPDIKTVKFQGLGEAYLAKDAIKMLEYCKSRNIDVVSITNCLWNHIDIPYLMTLLKHMYISYHAADATIYHEICGGGNWELLHKNIKEIVENKGECEVLLNCVISEVNYKYLSKIIERAHELKINYVRFQIMQNWTTEGEELYRDLAALKCFDEKELIEKLKEAYKIAENLGVSIDLVGNDEFEYTQCIWPFERTYINKNGDVLACHMRPAPKYKVGNLAENTFDEIWNGKKLNIIRESLQNNCAPDMCKDCPYIFSANSLKRIRGAL